MYEIHSCIIDISHFTDLKEKKLTQNCLGDDGLVPHDFLHDLKLLQVVNQIRFCTIFYSRINNVDMLL